MIPPPFRDHKSTWEIFFSQSPMAIAISDVDANFIAINEQLCSFLEYSESELLRRTWHSITVYDDLMDDITMARKIVDGEIDSYELAKRYVTKTGQVKWARVVVQGVKGDDGKVTCLMAVILPIEVAKFDQNGQKAVLKFKMLDVIQNNWKVLTACILPAIGTVLFGFHEYMSTVERLNKWDAKQKVAEEQYEAILLEKEKEKLKAFNSK